MDGALTCARGRGQRGRGRRSLRVRCRWRVEKRSTFVDDFAPGPWKSGLSALRLAKYISSRPEGTVKGNGSEIPSRAPVPGSATGDSIKGGPRGYRGSAPRPGC